MFPALIVLALFAFCMYQSTRTNKMWEDSASKSMQTTELVRAQRDVYANALHQLIQNDKTYYITHPNKEIRELARDVLNNTFHKRLPEAIAYPRYRPRHGKK